MSVPPPESAGDARFGAFPATPVPARDAAAFMGSVSIWPRIAAYLVDAGIVGLAAAGTISITGMAIRGGLFDLPYIGIFMLWWLAVRVQGARVAGESPGKRLVGIRVVSRDGEPIGSGLRLLREGPLMLPYFVPFVAVVDALIAEGGERRSVRDRVAGTVVAPAPGHRPRRLRAAMVFVVTTAATVLLMMPIVTERAALDRARSETVSDCTRSGNIPLATCECVYRVLQRRVPKADLLQAAADRRASMPYDPDVLAVINVAFSGCRGTPSSAGGPTSA